MNLLEIVNESQAKLLLNAVPEIAVLIAGADGDIDEKETEWAEKITKIRSYSGPESLRDYYAKASQNFEENFRKLIESLPPNTDQRSAELSKRLTALNPIISRLDNDLAYDLYKSYLSFAKHVAKASGGWLRMWSISNAEKKFVDLPMLDEVILLEPREETWEDGDNETDS